MTQRVRDVMHGSVISVTPATPLPAIERQLQLHTIRHLPVMDRGRIIGMVSLSDVRAVRPPEVASLRRYERGTVRNDLTAATIMSHPAINIAVNSSLSRAMRLMLKYKIRSLPVLRGGQLVGIITAGDLLRQIASNLGASDQAIASPAGPRSDAPDESGGMM